MTFRAETVGAEWFDQNVPCTQACPVLTNAGQYVSQIAAGDDELALSNRSHAQPFPLDLRQGVRCALRARLPSRSDR